METEDLEKIEEDIHYDFITSLGLSVIHYSQKLIKVISSLLLFLLSLFKKISRFVRYKFRKLTANIKKERKDFNNDVKIARVVYKNNKKADIIDRRSSFSLLYKFVKEAFTRHKNFLNHTLNLILPFFAVIVLIVVIKYNNNLDFALKVTYNNVDLGYIENETVFKEAENIIKDRLSLGGQEYSSDVISQPKYKISVVHPNELTDSTEICEKIIENSDSGLITACGVYVDDKFICSVKNESDASYVFKNLVSDYCKENNINQKNSKYIIDIFENVKYIQGLYSEKTLMTSEEIVDYINSKNKSEGSTYTFKDGDSVEKIKDNYNLTTEQFYALNPAVKKDNIIKTGTKLNVIRNIPFINISISKTNIKTKEIKYKTIEVKTDLLYQGTTKVVKEGKNGKKEVTTLISYFNNEKVSEKEIKSVIKEEPVDEKVYVGTKPVPTSTEINGVGTGTFIWPAIGADIVTSEFGYRILYGELNFHRGLDISGANALGKTLVASAPGVVEQVTAGNTGYGYSVLIDHGNGIKTRYGHCLAGSIIVQVGEPVEQGQPIAQIGNTGNSTGPHVHFEIMYNGAYADPLKYLTR